MPKDNQVLDRLVQGCERLEQELDWRKSKTVHLLRGDRLNTRLKSWSSSGVDVVMEAHNEEEIAEDEDSKKVKRTQRKMSRKRP